MSDKVKVMVLYHKNCLDGLAAAWVAREYFKTHSKATIECLPVQYNEDPPDVTGAVVCIVDFSYKKDVLLQMAGNAEAVFVLDHHKTAQEDLEHVSHPNLVVKFDMDRSGCVLTFWYFFPMRPIPTLLLHIQDRDLWKFKMKGTKEVCHALFNEGLTLEVMDKYLLGVGSVRDLKWKGEILLNKQTKDVQYFYENSIHPVTLFAPEAYHGFAANVPSQFSSDLGNLIAEQEGTFGMTYQYHPKTNQWICSLRSIGNLDVSKIAKFYGGGGHKNAAGFTLPSYRIREILPIFDK